MEKKHNLIAILTCSALLLGSCGGSSEAAKAAQAAIDALPASYSETADDAIEFAQGLYDALPENERSDVNAEKLNSLKAEQQKIAETNAAETEKFEKAVKELKLSTDNTKNLENSAKSLDEITKILKDLPDDVKKNLDYAELNSKTGKCTDAATSHLAQLNSDAENILDSGDKHESAWDWANANNMPAAYSDMLEAAYALERVKLFDAKAAAQAAKVVSSDFEDFILRTGDVNGTINDDKDFVSKRKTLAEKVVSELESYGDALELYEKSLKALTEQL